MSFKNLLALCVPFIPLWADKFHMGQTDLSILSLNILSFEFFIVSCYLVEYKIVQNWFNFNSYHHNPPPPAHRF